MFKVEGLKGRCWKLGAWTFVARGFRVLGVGVLGPIPQPINFKATVGIVSVRSLG